MLNIAVIEDNDDLRAAIVGALVGQGHHVVGLDCAEALAEQSDALAIDLMVVDLNLPGEDGISLARRLRDTQPEIGIVMVTARGRSVDRRIGYENGADIYLAKPVSLDELTGAIFALSRRLNRAHLPKRSILVDAHRLALKGPDGHQRLSAQEAALLAAFARAPDHRLESWQIIEIFDQAERAPNRNAMNVTISRLAAKLRQAGAAERPIRSIRNWGYQLCEPIALG